MGEKLEVILGGFGGQGIVLMGTILGSAAVKQGLWASGANSYGAQARGSACKAEVLISSEPLDYPRVMEANVLIALSQEAYNRFLPQVMEDGLVIYDDPFVVPERPQRPRHVGVCGTKWVLERIGSVQTTNMFFLGFLSGLTDLISMDALSRALEESVSENLLERNLRALEGGYIQGLEMRKRDGQAVRVSWGK